MNIKDANIVVCTVPAEDVTRVKGLGCLRDKTTPDRFNCRVLTRNGKITAAESMAIAQAAEKFGSGEVAMTTRQTIEIQGAIKIENLSIGMNLSISSSASMNCHIIFCDFFYTIFYNILNSTLIILLLKPIIIRAIVTYFT